MSNLRVRIEDDLEQKVREIMKRDDRSAAKVVNLILRGSCFPITLPEGGPTTETAKKRKP